MQLIGVSSVELPRIDFETLATKDFQVLHVSTDYEKNIDIQLARFNTHIQNKELEVAKYGHYPKLDFTFSYNEYETNDRTVDYKNDLRAVLEFKIPLYQGGRIESQIEKNRLLLLASHEELRDQEKEVRIKYEEVVINFVMAKEAITLQKKAIESAKLYLESIQEGYEHGLKSLIDLEDAKAKLYEMHFKLIDAVYNVLSSYVELLNLSGNFSKKEIESLETVIFQ